MHKRRFSYQLTTSFFLGTMSLDTSLLEKESFYAQIDAIDAPLNDEDEEIGGDFDLRKQSQAFFSQLKRAKQRSNQAEERPHTPLPAQEISTPKLLVRATTLPVTKSDRTSAVVKATPFTVERGHESSHQDQYSPSTSFVEDTPFQNPLPSILARLQRTATTPASLSSMTTKSLTEQSPSVMPGTDSKKRVAKGRGRSKSNTKGNGTVPESEQILKGLRFFYVPEYRISVRKGRMERAEEFGAVVTRDILDCTHVIVDDNLKYDDIKSIISPVLGKESPLIVGAHWPIYCIHEARILPISAKYRVRGMPALGENVASSIQVEPHPMMSQALDKSLQVKTPRKDPDEWDYVTSHTPSQSNASPVQRPNKRKTESINLELGSAQETDEGDVIIPSSQAPPQESAQHADAGNNTRQRRSARSGEGDELSHLISRVREEFKDLPRLGEDDGFLSPEGEEDDNDTDDERSTMKRKKSGNKKTRPTPENKKNFEEYFACNRGGTKDQASRPNNPNARTIAVLQQMLAYYEQTNDHWRLRAYRNAINTLSRAPVLITTAEEAEELPWFGKRLARKLEEIVNTNTLQRLEHALHDPTSKTLSLFLGIYGVGKATADKWIAQGFRTLEDLSQKAELNTNQKIGIEHYDDLNLRIPRDEVTKLGAFVREEAARIDRDVRLLVGGSYRRGADNSGDVDIIITKPGTASSDDLVPFLERLVGNLTKVGFLTAELASHSNFGRDDGGSKWHGCCVLPPPNASDNYRGSSRSSKRHSYRPTWRRIDFLLVPETEYGAALIYFTGNDIFNRSMRLLASKKGMRLNQRGLYRDVLRAPYGRQKMTTGELIEGRDERKIFEILKVKWREPEERWC